MQNHVINDTGSWFLRAYNNTKIWFGVEYYPFNTAVIRSEKLEVISAVEFGPLEYVLKVLVNRFDIAAKGPDRFWLSTFKVDFTKKKNYFKFCLLSKHNNISSIFTPIVIEHYVVFWYLFKQSCCISLQWTPFFKSIYLRTYLM